MAHILLISVGHTVESPELTLTIYDYLKFEGNQEWKRVVFLISGLRKTIYLYPKNKIGPLHSTEK